MIVKIESAEHAEKVLRTLKDQGGQLVFDLDPKIDHRDVPLIYRFCRGRNCKDSEYLGNNLHGDNFCKSATYCSDCGCAMEISAVAMITIQSETVIARY